MKNLISLSMFIFVILSFNNLQAQIIYKWYDIPSGVSSNLNSVNTNLIVGDNGKILYRNTNGVFTTIQSGTTSNLNSVISITVSGYTNFITGSNGTILCSSNNGVNWISQNSGTSQNLFSYSKIVKFNNLVGLKNIVVGAGGTILLSSNNGTNWGTISSPYTSDLKSISYCSRNLYGFQSAVAVGNSGVIIRTSDAGYNWYSVTSGVVENLNYVYFPDTLTGFIAGNNGKILKSINSGVNWTSISSPTNANLTGISFENVNSGWIVGSNGTVLKTTNGGNNWITESAGITTNLKSIYATPNPLPYENVFAIGENGKIFNRLCDTLYFPFTKLNGNNILSYFNSSGIFNYKNTLDSSGAGFVWPKESMATAVFTTGITTAAYVNNSLRMASCCYQGEYRPGYCINGNFYTDNRFKFYKVKRGDNASNSFDWANWGQMVPYGAPFIDVNNNGIYDTQIDTPGVKNALQTIFVCLTDADYFTHTTSGEFGGGTPPLVAEMHLTAWCYDIPSLMDVQFIKSVIINKSNTPWTKTYFSLVCDPDLGWANDDYIGCDTTRRLGFCYNGTNYDQMYGTAPPAVGFDLLRGGFNRAVSPNVNIGFTSFNFFTNNSNIPPPCESDPLGEAYPAYLMMKGFKKDSTCFLDPLQNLGTSYKKTKYCYPGDPESSTGWREYEGSIPNCGRDSTGTPIVPNPVGDRRFVMGSGAENFTVVPNESQTIIIAQMIARGANNKISVTLLKKLADTVQNFYNNNLQIGITPISRQIPEFFNLYQNYPNPFNPMTKIRFDIPTTLSFPHALSGNPYISLKVYDITGREIQTLVNEKLNPGTYEVTFDGSNYASGVYFYQLRTGDFIETKKLILIK